MRADRGERLGTSVSPARYADAQDIENRLIALIDGGEDLAEWYTVEGTSLTAMKTSRVVDLSSTKERAADRWARTLAQLKWIQ